MRRIGSLKHRLQHHNAYKGNMEGCKAYVVGNWMYACIVVGIRSMLDNQHHKRVRACLCSSSIVNRYTE